MNTLKTIIVIISALLLSCVNHSNKYAHSTPINFKKEINENWTFYYFPREEAITGYQADSVNDAQWPVVALPHTWSTYETTGDVHPFIKYPSHRDNPYWWNGWGWYRKRFIISEDHKDKKVFIEFDGVQKYCKVWLNGKLLGDHKGGFTSFYFDLTEHINFGRENILAVAVSNKKNDAFGIPPLTAGNWDLYGGIYRDVHLVIKEKCYIPFQGSYKHEGGTFITTPKVTKERAIVNIKTWIKNEFAESRLVTLKSTICDSNGQIIEVINTDQMIASGELSEIKQQSQIIENPHLWSPETPYIYKVYSDIYLDDKLTDHRISPLGFRWFKWDYRANQLILNDTPVHIHGTNRHQEYPWLGDAMPKWLHLQDMNDIKYGLNHNFIRGAHYTHDKIIYDFCDQHGIIVCEEVPNIKAIDFSESVQEQMVREMIRRDRNHPSIFFWSVGNETTDGADSKWVVEEDTTRIIHARRVLAESYGDFVTHTHENMEMENLLRITVRGWYDRDTKDLEPDNPQSAGHEEWQHYNARIEGKSKRGRIDMYNGVMWLYADHGADREYENAPLKHINPKGWVDLYRIPKYMYYLWQANYAEEPMIFIHPHNWQQKYSGQKKDIVIDSNCESVELFVNGNSLGKKYPNWQNFHTVTFNDVLVQQGDIRAVGNVQGKSIEYKVGMAGAPQKLVLKPSHSVIAAKMNSVVTITANVLDSDDVPVLGFSNDLIWNIEGPATWVGPAVYQTDKNKHEAMAGTFYINMPVQNIIRSTGQPGEIKVTVSANGLKSALCVIKAEEQSGSGQYILTEPVPDLSGRQKVLKDSAYVNLLQTRSLEKMQKTSLDIEMKEGQHSYDRLAEMLRTRNPDIDPRTLQFTTILLKMVKHLENNNGQLIADDYNHYVDQFNTANHLIHDIEASNLTAKEKKQRAKEYIDRVLGQDEALDIKKELDKLHNQGLSSN